MYGKEEYESRVQRRKMQQTEAESSWFRLRHFQLTSIILLLIVILIWALSLDLVLTLDLVRVSGVGSPASVDLSIINCGQLGLLRYTDWYQLKVTKC
jgi:hypothetical protein